MLAVTTIASLDRGVFEAGADLWSDPWFRATLADAYFGFLAVYLWIAYKERSWGRRVLWFVLLMLLGNIAIAVYVLIQLFRLPDSRLDGRSAAAKGRPDMLEPITRLGLPGLVAALGLTTLVWLVSLVKRDVSIIDIFWSLGFVMLAWLYRSQVSGRVLPTDPGSDPGHALGPATVASTSSGATGDTARTTATPRCARSGARASRSCRSSSSSGCRAFSSGSSACRCCRCRSRGNPPGWTWLDLLGLALFAVGFFFESVGDFQLARFKADPANKGKVMDRGLWRYTRHPNYFGDATLWWGFGCFALATDRVALDSRRPGPDELPDRQGLRRRAAREGTRQHQAQVPRVRATHQRLLPVAARRLVRAR